jgi:hypothetical protein
MLLYFYWNKHIERYADLRFQGEITSPRDICRWSGFPDSKCDNGSPTQEIVEPVTTRKLGQNGRRRLSAFAAHSHSLSGVNNCFLFVNFLTGVAAG